MKQFLEGTADIRLVLDVLHSRMHAELTGLSRNAGTTPHTLVVRQKPADPENCAWTRATSSPRASRRHSGKAALHRSLEDTNVLPRASSMACWYVRSRPGRIMMAARSAPAHS